MAVIQELSPHLANLIAAGEVVERPSSAAKELIENAIDAGATRIIVEIQNGGIRYLRVTDDGCGMSPEDAPMAFRRHATSKLHSEQELSSIGTLGFRGEALAAIVSVSRVDLFTRPADAIAGFHLHLEAGKLTVQEDAGCPKGTTIIVRDLFFNTPARMKFLKKDFTEAGYILGVVQHAALSHPDIAFSLQREGKNVFSTDGKGKLATPVFAVFGKEMMTNMLEVPPLHYQGLTAYGFITKPHAGRSNRSMQHFFVNRRYIKSKVMQAALEEAYQNAILNGKYPSGVIFLDVPLYEVDVNVHPAKLEVKFSQEKLVFNAVYGACKQGLTAGDNTPQMTQTVLSSRSLKEDNLTDQQERLVMEPPSIEPTQIPSAPSALAESEEPLTRSSALSEPSAADRLAPSNNTTDTMGNANPVSVNRSASSVSSAHGLVRSASVEQGDRVNRGKQENPVDRLHREDLPPVEEFFQDIYISVPKKADWRQPLQLASPFSYTRTAAPTRPLPSQLLELSERTEQAESPEQQKLLDESDIPYVPDEPSMSNISDAPAVLDAPDLQEPSNTGDEVGEIGDGDTGNAENAGNRGEPLFRASLDSLDSLRVLGECFQTYLMAEDKDGLLFIDKHAAHERILFNQLKAETQMPQQELLEPIVVELTGEEAAAVQTRLTEIQNVGFSIEPFGETSFVVRSVPAYLDSGDVPNVIAELAEKAMRHRSVTPDRLDDFLHTVACRAAIKAGSTNSLLEWQDLCRRVVQDDTVRSCPHGRPVMVRLTRYELDKLFKRVHS